MAKAKVGIVLSDIFSVRNFFFTPLWDELNRAEDYEFVFVTFDDEHEAYVSENGGSHISWQKLGRREGLGQSVKHFLKAPSLAAAGQCARLVFEKINSYMRLLTYKQICYRFNEVAGFSTHRIKKELHKEFDETGVSPLYGWPMPESPSLLALLRKVYQADFWPTAEWIKTLFDDAELDRILIALPQSVTGFDLTREARRRGVPVSVYVNSWDQPTIKGPFPPGIDDFMVWNAQMKEELIRYHGIPGDKVEVVGAAHLDVFADKGLLLPREEFLVHLGLPSNAKFVLYGAYVPSVSPNEPEIIDYLADQFEKGTFGEDVYVIFRPHPVDEGWKTRFAAALNSDRIIGRPSNSYANETGLSDLQELTNLLNHAQFVCTGPSTLTLDSLCFGTPVINVAFDGSEGEGCLGQFYGVTHYVPVMQSGGCKVVKNFDELDAAIFAYVENRDKDMELRVSAKARFCDPFDGSAGNRIYNAMIKGVTLTGEGSHAVKQP
ncbi:CDP-glycerol glycerophosphotransferase family protein [Pseudodesulfovibrio sp. zrk46]|uniref:CDP-glycerol glycerophosphotransferase family protein n=1 Tax=Pseudodesulfovibrio sp. zrk46 TaxID=2725288 RepID=UPI001449DFDA|nr:CDP-glycerol glycerophosphotransferase family protein [Pseudodesulfovibrio sp. zrk46]QJB56584.1 hypothetical protein HFN16_09255 [Pseudodesulfovibrio sp. zrk46]